jgi:flagellar M-ring protein FliF
MNDFLRRAGEYIRKVMSAMTPGQLIGLVVLVVLLIGSIVWAISIAGKNGFVELAGADVPMDVKADIKKKLAEMKKRFEIRDGAIYVLKEERDELQMDLIGEGFFSDKQIESWVWGTTDLTSTADLREYRKLLTLQKKLEKMISSIAAVKSARVQITPPTEQWRLGFEGPPPKSSVLLALKQGKKLSQQNIFGIAQIVANSVKGLQPENVSIMDTSGVLYKIPKPDSDTYFATERTESELKIEKMFEEKVRNLFPLVKDLYISARVVFDYTRTKTTSEKTEMGVDTKVDEYTKTTTTPGVGGPAGIKGERALAPAETTASASTEKKTTTIHEPSKTVTLTEKPPGDIKEASIAVAFPKGTINMTESDIKDMVSKGIGIEPASINVTFIDVPKPPTADMAKEEITIWERIYEIWERFGGQIFLALVAMFSIFLIYRIVKNTMAKPVVTALPAREERALEAMPLEEIAKLEVGETKSAQMRTAVKELVQRNPRSVATMLKRWLVGK